MKILIIGLGIYGMNLARDLVQMGNEVIAADRNDIAVEQIKDIVSAVYRIDTTDEVQMNVLPLKSVDIVVVAIGEDFGASIRTVAILKSLGVKKIFARAIDPLHKAILESFNPARILTPEQRAASVLTLEMNLGTDVETLAIDADRFIAKFAVPEIFVGEKYVSAARSLLKHHKMTLVAATRAEKKTNIIGISVDSQYPLDITDENLLIESGDILTCLTTRKALRSLSV